jgi:hypothetical protein
MNKAGRNIIDIALKCNDVGTFLRTCLSLCLLHNGTTG